MRVVLTGESGRLVTRFREYVEENRKDVQVQLLSVRGEAWKNFDFCGCDVVMHCAGIVNSASDSYEEYERINVELTRQVFEKCVADKVTYFLYLSSMAVYDGTQWGFGEHGRITEGTTPIQKSNYGKSKYAAEMAIASAQSGETKVGIVRAPSIVGHNMEDYFKQYIRFSKIPLLPIPRAHLEAKRSFVYVDTLIEFMCHIAEKNKIGIFYPQNYPLLSVSEMFGEVCKAQDKKRLSVPIPSGILPDAVESRLFRQICYAEELSKEENLMVGKISTTEAIRLVVNERGITNKHE